ACEYGRSDAPGLEKRAGEDLRLRRKAEKIGCVEPPGSIRVVDDSHIEHSRTPTRPERLARPREHEGDVRSPCSNQWGRVEEEVESLVRASGAEEEHDRPLDPIPLSHLIAVTCRNAGTGNARDAHPVRGDAEAP